MKSKQKACAVLLAGGRGKRLWPLSGGRVSKPFLSIAGSPSMALVSTNRLRGVFEKKSIYYAVDKGQAGYLKKTIKGLSSGNIIIEPFPRNTASAIGLASLQFQPETILAFLPVDNYVEDGSQFKKVIREGIDFVESRPESIICVGLRPYAPMTGYGYIKISGAVSGRVHRIAEFIEKPPLDKAKRFYKNPAYLWNGGIYIGKAGAILEEIKEHSPGLYSGLEKIKQNSKNLPKVYSRMKNISIDYQIMEKSRNIYCLKAEYKCHDIGNWTCVEKILPKDKNGNVIFGNAKAIDARGAVIYNSEKKKVGLIGLDNVIVVNTRDGVLVGKKDEIERVREI